MEFIDLFNSDYIVDKLKEAYKLYIDDNYSDYPGRHIRFKVFVEKVLLSVIAGDENKFSLLIPNNQYIYEDLTETFVNSKLVKPLEEGYHYYVTYISSLNLVYLEREPT